MQRYLDMVGEFIDYTLSRDNVSYVTTEQLMHIEKSAHRALSSEEINQLAGLISDEVGFISYGDLNLSASELFWVFRQHLLALNPLPELVYGPEQDVQDEWPEQVREQEQASLRVKDILDALRSELPTVCGFKQLPDYFLAAGYKISPATMMCTMASVIRGGLSASDPIVLTKGTLSSEQYSSMTGEWTKWWPIFTKDLKVPNIIEQARLQTWTLKPALF